jgi:hypothetical protein
MAATLAHDCFHVNRPAGKAGMIFDVDGWTGTARAEEYFRLAGLENDALSDRLDPGGIRGRAAEPPQTQGWRCA